MTAKRDRTTVLKLCKFMKEVKLNGESRRDTRSVNGNYDNDNSTQFNVFKKPHSQLLFQYFF